jgi:hypothetical protein
MLQPLCIVRITAQCTPCNIPEYMVKLLTVRSFSTLAPWGLGVLHPSWPLDQEVAVARSSFCTIGLAILAGRLSLPRSSTAEEFGAEASQPERGQQICANSDVGQPRNFCVLFGTRNVKRWSWEKMELASQLSAGPTRSVTCCQCVGHTRRK